MTQCPLRIGNQTSLSAELMAPFEYALANRFSAFEWFPDGWDAENIDRRTREYIREISSALDISLSVHLPWHANPLQSPFELFRENILFAKDIGAGLVNIHFHHEAEVEAYLQALSPIIRLTADEGLRLSIENTVHTGPEEFNRLFSAISRMEVAGHVGMCLDIGHANLCSDTRNDYLRFLDLLQLHVPVIHLHLHENYGDQDSHLPLFSGPSASNPAGIHGLLARIMRRGFTGLAILEQWPADPSLLNNARDRLCLMAAEIQAEEEKRDRENFLEALVEADRKKASWREKLLWVRDALSERTDKERLVATAIYLRFIGTGQLPCREDGHHYRPGHNARAAEEIEGLLSHITDLELNLIIRKIHPWLPSYGEPFKRAEPLTRIREIAHRNDIPQDLKKEIKHTLQNKLHRCAGPEDLVTSEEILQRITAPGADYSPPFVEEFKIFHQELKEFFNARDLEEQLEALIRKGLIDREGEALTASFLAAKKREEPALAGQLHLLQAITGLRAYLCAGLQHLKGAEAQQLRLAEIRLEDYAFAVASGIMNLLPQARQSKNWQSHLELLILLLDQIRLSGMEPDECRAILADLRQLSKGFSSQDRNHLLSVKAELERCSRLTQEYTDSILSLFVEKVEQLGRMLHLSETAIRFYAEGDIRGNMIFQLSKLSSLLIKEIRQRAGLSPWDPIVTGKAEGTVTLAGSIHDLPSGERLVALLERVDGDEEIPLGIKGIIIGHDLPHLSHLGVRARQQGVLLAVSDDETELQRLKKFAGKEVALSVTPDTVFCEPAVGLKAEEKAPERLSSIPEVSLNPERPLITLADVTLQTGGSKAFSARRLEELSRKKGAGFRTAKGLVVPFGMMEEALRFLPELAEEYRRLAGSINDMPPKEFDQAAARLREIITQLPVAGEIIRGTAELFGTTRVFVRSSSNAEDLQDMAGAGLYDSIANVLPSEAGKAIAQVWASLWTRRAALSRRQLGFPHEKAHMAVFIQEMIVPDYSFILHTVNPVSGREEEVYMELAPGLGEVLASGNVRGLPYRMTCNTDSHELKLLSFASFSKALRPGETGVVQETVDYSEALLSRDEKTREGLASRLAAVGRFIEAELAFPQDIEGVVKGEDIYLVQTRPQQGLKKKAIQ